MKKFLWIAGSALTLLLAACSTSSTPPAIPTLVLNSQPQAGSSVGSSGSVSASGQIVPVRKVQLSFPLTGVVKTIAVKAGDTVSADQSLVSLDTTLFDAQVREGQANVAAAKTEIDYLTRIGTDQDHLNAAQAQVDIAQAQLDLAQATLAQTTLTAPFDGTIAEVDISPAETVVPGQTIITMGDLSHFQVETTDLSERDVPSVKVGQPASITVQALNQSFPARVTAISHISSTLGGDVVYKVTLEFEDQPQGLLWGMSTDVTIQTGS